MTRCRHDLLEDCPDCAIETIDALVKALQELLRFCDDATEYEATHAYKYNPYIDAKALLSAVGGPR